MLIVSLSQAHEIKRRSMDLFRRSTGPPSSRPGSSSDPESSPGDANIKKTRFSMFRGSGRRSGLILEPSVFCDTSIVASLTSSLTSDDEPSSVYPSDGSIKRSLIETTDERRRALARLEGRNPPPMLEPNRRASSNTNSEDAQETTAPGARRRPSSLTIPTSFRNALQLTSVIPGRSGSVASRRSMSNDERRSSSRLDRVPEDGTIPLAPAARSSLTLREGADEPHPQSQPRLPDGETEQQRAHAQETDEHGLPTYASAAFPSHPTTYRFAQAGPFASTVSAGDEEIAGLGRYHVSVGVNVWAPRSGVTIVRRGLTEDGPIVGQIE
ncbi:hypothetical protein BD311DRAFT_846925 [Dichomitus squalens]|uniref:Uncharacterized protein n=1 Tax=Dichomitus squalens TaxID=114155 RepID=A0A4Q9MIV4_9APHY|nr:hypothetical protein BD311DRAFT_846925 [Dichomitus squalens]